MFVLLLVFKATFLSNLRSVVVVCIFCFVVVNLLCIYIY